MTTETILTDVQIVDFYHQYQDTDGISFGDTARAIEQAFLQSPEIQALRRDAELWRALQEHSVVTIMNDHGRKLAIATIELDALPDQLTLEQFVCAAMEQQK